MIALLLLATSSFAAPTPAPALAAPAAIDGVEIVERLGAPVPRDLVFRAEDGHELALGSLFDPSRPVILYLGYSRCPMLCDIAQGSLTTTLKGTGLELGRDFDIVTVSIDPREAPQTAAGARRGRLQALGIADTSAVWPFLVGDEPAIRKLANAVGFHYRYDAKTGDFAHAAAFFVLTPDGRVSRYVYGLPDSPRDLRLALVEAAGGRIGSSFDRLLLTCWHYDPSTRRYGWAMSFILQGGAILVMAGLGSMLGLFWWREVKTKGIR